MRWRSRIPSTPISSLTASTNGAGYVGPFQKPVFLSFEREVFGANSQLGAGFPLQIGQMLDLRKISDAWLFGPELESEPCSSAFSFGWSQARGNRSCIT